MPIRDIFVLCRASPLLNESGEMNIPTRSLVVTPTQPDPELIIAAAAVIRAGGLVAFPTETVYGLGANALDAAAVERIFVAKERPATDPLIVHLESVADLARVVAAPPPSVERLAAACWPGPLTLILPRAPGVPPAVSAGRDTVAVRLPSHPVARALIRAAATPIVAPSANRFGHTSPTTAAHVLADLAGRIELVLDGGPTPIGLESTVLDLTAPTPTVLRPGAISLARLQELLGSIALAEQTLDAAAPQPAPGMLERHYAPNSELWLHVGPAEAGRAWLRARAAELHAAGRRVGLLVADEDAALLAAPGLDIEPLGSAADLDQVARRLYAALRNLDARHPDVILTRDFGDAGLALAIRDRLTRAAGGRVVRATRDA